MPPPPEPHPVWRATRLDISDITWIPDASAIEARAASMR